MFRRIILFAFSFLLLAGSLAFAGDWGKVMTPKTPLNVRQERTLASDRVTTIMPGEKIRADFLENDWYAIFRLDVTERKLSKALGFVKAGYLVPAGEWGELCSPRGMLNIRSKRSLSSEHVRTLRPGDVVKIDFEENGWVAIFVPDEQVRSLKNALGYSNRKYLFPATPEQIDRALGGKEQASSAAEPNRKDTPETAPGLSGSGPKAGSESVAGPVRLKPNEETDQTLDQEPATSGHWGRLVKVSRRVNMRAERTAASKLVNTLKPGQAVRVDFLRKGWFAAFKPGETRRDEQYALGYIYAALIEDDMGPLPELTPSDRQAVPPEMREIAESRAGSGPEVDEGAPLYQVRGTVRNAPPEELREAAGATDPASEFSPEEPATTPKPYDSAGAEPFSRQAAELESRSVRPDKAPEELKGPVPVADQVRHGFRYALLERQESREGRYPLDILRIYLDTNVVPEADSLSDFCSTLWKEEWRQGTLLRVDVYLPGMNLKDLSYAEAMFVGKGLQLFWTREAVLYGTRFKR
ncbi:MAG: SH3 domain-containing protein [Desulfovibrio sp.]